MAKFKLTLYVILMSFVYAALGGFLASMCFMFLGHSTVGTLNGTLHITPTQFFIACVSVGVLGAWLGWGEGAKSYLPSSAKPV